jgi:phage terminase small subunit
VAATATSRRQRRIPTVLECLGFGLGRTIVHDTRGLSRAAAALYAGGEETNNGIQVLTNSKDGARDQVFRHLALYERDNKQKIDPLLAMLEGRKASTLPVSAAPGEAE